MPKIARTPRRKWSDPLPPGASETTISAAIRSHVNRLPWARLWRNNNGSLQDAGGRWVTYGLGTGSPDLIGVVVDKATGIGRFVGIEVKRGRRKLDPDQIEWKVMLLNFCAVHGEVRSVEDALAVVAHARGVQVEEVWRELGL